jgi:hypothetical protein
MGWDVESKPGETHVHVHSIVAGCKAVEPYLDLMVIEDMLWMGPVGGQHRDTQH